MTVKTTATVFEQDKHGKIVEKVEETKREYEWGGLVIDESNPGPGITFVWIEDWVEKK